MMCFLGVGYLRGDGVIGGAEALVVGWVACLGLWSG
jgi:hypothetical protein